MPTRIWVAEGVASDGAIYGRSLQIPGENSGTAVHRASATVLKSHLGDIPSCPCLAALSAPDVSHA